MKKIKIFALTGFISMLMSSCVVASYHEITGNPIGKKEGFVKSKGRNFDIGYAAAAKAGKITKIGSVDVKYYLSGKISVKVTGE